MQPLNSLVSGKEIKSVVKNLYTTKASDLGHITGKFFQIFKEEKSYTNFKWLPSDNRERE